MLRPRLVKSRRFRGLVCHRPIHNPWGAATLEWQTPEYPPGHGNWGATQPVVYRWAYAYSVPGADKDFTPQNEPPDGASGDDDQEDLSGVATQPAE